MKSRPLGNQLFATKLFLIEGTYVSKEPWNDICAFRILINWRRRKIIIKKSHLFLPGKLLLFISKSAITVDTSAEIYECRKHFRSFISIAITIDGKAQWLDEDVNKTQLPYDCQKLLLAFLRQHVNKFNLLQLIYLFYYNYMVIWKT